MRHAPQFRPPAEAESLILQVDEGCPYNRCRFCAMYQDMPFRRRPLNEVHRLIELLSRRYPDVRRVFLADGDVMHRPAAELKAILEQLGQSLPRLARVNLYATGRAIAAKSDAELRRLRELRMHTIYLGLESGDEEALRQMEKGETASHMVEAGMRAQDCGLHLSVIVLIGLAGRKASRRHAQATAAALNLLQPRLLSVLRLIPIPGTPLDDDIKEGRFEPLSELQAVEELRELVAGLQLNNTIFRANHSSNILPLEARLPNDQQRLLGELKALLHSGGLDEAGPGLLPLGL
jgi:radical SAM superfamily enzyme YgiQ (UPF0313 family)